MTEKLFGKEITWDKGFVHSKQLGHASRYPFSGSLTRSVTNGEESYILSVKIDGRSNHIIRQKFETDKHSLSDICRFADEKCQEVIEDMKWWFK